MRLAAWKVFIRVNFSSKCASCIYYTLYKEVQQICICHDLEFGKWEVVFGVWDLVFRVDKEVRSLREHSTSLMEEHTNVPRHTIAIFTNCIRAQLHRHCTTVAPCAQQNILSKTSLCKLQQHLQSRWMGFCPNLLVSSSFVAPSSWPPILSTSDVTALTGRSSH